MSEKSIEQVLEERTEEWMALPGVVGTALGQRRGRPCIRILVIERTPEIDRRLPSDAEGYPVEVITTGRFDARGSPS